jgi:ankyrin repeat protein
VNVLAAGELIFYLDDGQWSLLTINNGSGHYRPVAHETLPLAKKYITEKINKEINVNSLSVLSLRPGMTLASGWNDDVSTLIDVIGNLQPQKLLKAILKKYKRERDSVSFPSKEVALHRAACCDMGDVLFLLESGASINEQDSVEKRTALHQATRSGRIDIVEVLIKKGADLSIKDKSGKKPADYTADNNTSEGVKKSLKEKVTTKKEDQKISPVNNVTLFQESKNLENNNQSKIETLESNESKKEDSITDNANIVFETENKIVLVEEEKKENKETDINELN